MQETSIPSPRRGLFFILLAMFIFSVLNALIKEAVVRYDPLQLVFFRCFFAAFPAAIFMVYRKAWIRPTKAEWNTHFKRAFLIAIGFSFLFLGIGTLSLSNSMALYFSSTFFLVLLSYPILRERIRFWQWIAVVVGIIGVVIIAKPSGDVLHWGTLFVILGAFMEAAYNLYGRLLSNTHNPFLLTFLGSLLPGLLALIPLPYVWITPDSTGWLALLGLGLGGGVGQLCVTFAYRYAPAGSLAPMIYSAMLWSCLLDIILYANWPTTSLLLGCGVIIVSGLIVLFSDPTANETASN